MNLSSHDSRRYIRLRRLWIIALFPLWELIRRSFEVNPLLMPPLAEIFTELIHGITGGKLAARWLLSMALVSGGLAAGTVLAMILVLISGTGRAASSCLSLISSLMHPLPGLALLPLVILWFGTGTNVVMFIIIHAVLWNQASVHWHRPGKSMRGFSIPATGGRSFTSRCPGPFPISYQDYVQDGPVYGGPLLLLKWYSGL